MPVCIAGMHRSGTSMIAKVLSLGGLYLGEESELMPPLPENQDGFWEHLRFVELNDRILESLGGWWDCPPAFADGWQGAAMQHFSGGIQALLARFDGREPWGWKDPRNSLTLPLWRSAAPRIKTIICLRNPLEVAISLRKRNTFSYALGMQLWWIYNRRLMETTSPQDRIVTHYDAYFNDASAEAHRLLEFCELPADGAAVAHAAGGTARDLRHSRFTVQDLFDAHAPRGVIDLYLDMCQQAGWVTDSPPQALINVHHGPKMNEPSPMPAPAAAPGASTDGIVLGAARHDRLRDLRKKVTRLEQEVVALQAKAQANLHAAELKFKSELEEAEARVILANSREEPLRQLLRETQERLVGLEDRVRAAAVTSNGSQQVGAKKKASGEPPTLYQQLVKRMRKKLCAVLPAEALVATVSKGDDAFLQLGDRKTWHFPPDDNGAYAGYNPPDSRDAIRRLESLRKKGVRFLVFPNTAFWWFDHYAGFHRHLQRHARKVLANKDCIVFRLAEVRPATRKRSRRTAKRN